MVPIYLVVVDNSVGSIGYIIVQCCMLPESALAPMLELNNITGSLLTNSTGTVQFV
jgi:hypothetical protein